MIVHRQLCDGILKGWNQDPATVFHPYRMSGKSAVLSSFN